jgi:hypothetical protein
MALGGAPRHFTEGVYAGSGVYRTAEGCFLRIVLISGVLHQAVPCSPSHDWVTGLLDCYFLHAGPAAFSAAARRSVLLKWLENPREDGGA